MASRAYTPLLLDQLQRLHVRATFFEIGFMFRWFHASVTRELRMGDVIGDLAGARPGAIILMHDAGGDRTQTIAALPLIVHALRRRGYLLVTIPRLIHDDPPLRPQILPPNLAGG